MMSSVTVLLAGVRSEDDSRTSNANTREYSHWMGQPYIVEVYVSTTVKKSARCEHALAYIVPKTLLVCKWGTGKNVARARESCSRRKLLLYMGERSGRWLDRETRGRRAAGAQQGRAAWCEEMNQRGAKSMKKWGEIMNGYCEKNLEGKGKPILLYFVRPSSTKLSKFPRV